MTETVSSYHFTIAELNVNIQFKESVRNGMHLLPSFEPFKSEAVADDHLFFKLIVDDALPPIRKPHRERIGRFDTGNGITVVDQLPDGGYQFIIKDINGGDCCLLQTDKEFALCHCALNGNYNMRCFGLNNALMLIFAFAVVATSNAVNISDGLDGLSGGLAMMAYGAYGVIALFQGNIMLFGFCLTVVGWLLSYIWFNVPPARFMMGDTGSFALGAGLGVVSMMTNSFLLLPVIGLPFVVEAGSSLIQLFSKKVFHKKIFISAPLHHHLEALGWGEAKIVMRFWIVAGVCAILGVFIAATGGAI